MHENDRRAMSSSIPTGAGLTQQEAEKLKDEKRVQQNQFNLLFGFAVGVFVGVVWEVLRRR